MTTLPPLPTAPPAGATAAERQAFEDAMAVYRAAAGALHAQAQADTAVAMQASVAAQAALAAAMNTPAPRHLPTRAELVWELTKVQPQASILTPSQIVSGAAQIVDAYIKAHPGAVAP